MTDAAISTDLSADPVPILPAPDLAVNIGTVAPAETPEIEHPVGSLRQAILDHLEDTEEPQTVAQILAAMPAGTSRNTC